MAVILSIDTATAYAGVALSNDEHILAIQESVEQKNHASFVQPAIEKVLADAGISINAIDAVAVTQGPGSYTGLRVGLSSAKGLCYALHKPLILVSTLEVMAYASITNNKESNNTKLFCPMIDARRMEVFTAVYDENLQSVLAPAAMILNENSFENLLRDNYVVLSGDGAAKFAPLLFNNEHAVFSTVNHNITHLGFLAYKAFKANAFANLAYSEPFYLKEFFNPLMQS